MVGSRRLAMLFPLLLAGCAFGDSGSQANGGGDAPRHTVPLSAGHGYFMDLAWLRGGWLAITYYAHPLTPSAFPELWRAKSDGSSFSQIALPAETACQHTSYKFLSPLAHGRVAVTQACH